jgi:hypothetical protein
MSGRLLPVLILGLMGAAFVCIGVALGVFVARGSSAEADRAEQTLSLSAAALEERAPGSAAMVEGTLSPRNKPRLRDFVAYTHESYQGTDDDGDERWTVEERVTPPLLVDLADGSAQIGNADYRLEGAHDLWVDGGNRYGGIVSGQPMMAIGVIQAGSEGHELRADLVFAGTRAAYIAAKRDNSRVLPLIGLSLGGIGALLLGVGAWIGLRR